RDRVELHRRPTGRPDALLDLRRERAVVEVAGHRLGPRRGDADDRLRERLVVEADALELGARRGARRALEEGAGVVLGIQAGHGPSSLSTRGCRGWSAWCYGSVM